MVEYLEKLVEDRHHQRALEYAEQLLFNRHVSMRELMVINCMMLTCRVMTGEHHGAAISGQLGLRLSRDLEEWEYHGWACVDLSLSYILMRQYDLAIEVCYEYLAQLPYYGKMRESELKIWYNLGYIHARQARGSESIRCFKKAVEVATRSDNLDDIHRVRHALIGAHMASGDHLSIPRLLAKCLHHLRHSATNPQTFESKLWHLVLRSEFGLSTERFDRARKVAHYGLTLAAKHPRHGHQFHMILSRIAHAEGNLKAALGHCLSARVFAIQCQRYDLESDASDLMYKVAVERPGALTELGPEHVFPLLELTRQPTDVS